MNNQQKFLSMWVEELRIKILNKLHDTHYQTAKTDKKVYFKIHIMQ